MKYFKYLDHQKITFNELQKLIDNGLLAVGNVSIATDGHLIIAAGIAGECDIEIACKFIDAYKFYPGG